MRKLLVIAAGAAALVQLYGCLSYNEACSVAYKSGTAGSSYWYYLGKSKTSRANRCAPGPVVIRER